MKWGDSGKEKEEKRRGLLRGKEGETVERGRQLEGGGKRRGLLRGKEGKTVDGEERGKEGKWEGEELKEKREWVGRRKKSWRKGIMGFWEREDKGKGRRLKGRESGKEERRKEKCGWHGGGGVFCILSI